MIVQEAIAFRTQNETSYDIKSVKIELTDNDIENIKKASKLVQDNSFIENIRVSVDGEVEFLNENDEVSNNDWRCDVMQFIVYNDVFYFYAQNKWESSDQIESGEIKIERLN